MEPNINRTSRILLILLNLLLATLDLGSMTNIYCDLRHCGEFNLPCMKHQLGNGSCPSDTKWISLYSNRSALLRELNIFRNRVANGYSRTLFPAARMSRVDWSKELEYFAKLYIEKCQPLRYTCMSSPNFTNIGCMSDGVAFTDKKKSQSVLATEVLTKWFGGARFLTRAMSMKLTPYNRRPLVYRSTLLMTDRNSHMGCSAVTYTEDSFNHFLMACAFATDNMNEYPVYKPSAKPGSGCVKRDRVYNNLCAIGEKYNNNHVYHEGELIDWM